MIWDTEKVYKKRRKKVSDKLDKAVSRAFNELHTIEQLVYKLRLTLGHLEEVSKKNRDELIETQKEEEKEYEGV